MRVLIVSPHMDDEVLGCSSWLQLLENEVFVVYSTRTHPLYPCVAEENDKLFRELLLDANRRWLNCEQINRLDLLGQEKLVTEHEKVIEEVKPDLLLVPCSSYNQDHRAVFDATLTACRPHDRNFFVKKILSYEQPETWGTLRSTDFFNANYFRRLDMEFKLSCYRVYASQIRGHRSEEHLQAIAKFRGMQCGMEFAEAFEVLRWVE